MSAGERFCDAGRGVRLCFETFGDPGHAPLLLIAGLGQQLNSWPVDLCRALAARDLYVLRFDNRDAGRSSRAANAAPTTLQLLTRRWNPDQYTLSDMARDVVGLLAANDLDDAHLVGMSMGGMIGQTVAAQYPERVRTLTSIMSTTGARRVGRPALSTWRMMLARPPADRETAIERALVLWRHIGSHGFPFDEDQVRALVGESWDRGGGSPDGTARQLAAILRSGDRTREVRRIKAPTLVIHGDRDLMVHPTGGEVTAAAIPGARLETIRGMGHDLPVGAWPQLLDLICDHAARAAVAV